MVTLNILTWLVFWFTHVRGTTFAVLSRYVDSDLPYVEKFLFYYLDWVAVDHVYLVVAKPLLFAKDFRAVLSRIEQRCGPDLVTAKELTTRELSDDIGRGAQNVMLNNIKEDYVFHVDLDEFWATNGIPRKNTEEYHRGIWKILSFEHGCARVLRGGMSKYLVKTSNVKWFGEHHPILKQKRNSSTTDFVYHYWGRSFEDVLLKLALNKDRFSRAMPKPDELPARLKLLAIINRALSCHGSWDSHCNLRNMTNHSLETQILLNFYTMQDVRILQNRYENFKSQLECPPKNLLQQKLISILYPDIDSQD